MAKPLLSFFLIVRDGGAGLSRCLQSVRRIADEMVVVDTGSTDDSVARARRADARVIQHEWQDDFAAARNAALAELEGEWALFLDADEWLEPPNPAWLREQLARREHAGYFLPVRSPVSATGELVTSVLRVFRTDHAIRFRYPIHEQVLDDLVPWAAARKLRLGWLPELTVRHEGYRESEMVRLGKHERNDRLFRKALARHPDHPYLWFKYADALRSFPDRAEEKYRAAAKAYTLLGDRRERRQLHPFHAEACAVYVASLLEQGLRREALEVLDRHDPASFDSPSYQFVGAMAREAAGDFGGALHLVEECLRERPLQPTVTRRPGVTSHLGQTLKARLCLRLGRAGPALEAAREALRSHPEEIDAIALSARSLAELGRGEEALRSLAAALRRHPDSSELWLQTGLVMLALGLAEKAVPYLRRASGMRAARLCLGVLGETGATAGEGEREDVELLRAVYDGRAPDVLPARRDLMELAPVLAAAGKAPAAGARGP